MLLHTKYNHIVNNIYVQWGTSPIWTASFHGHDKCVQLLIEAGAIIDLPEEPWVSVAAFVHISTETTESDKIHTPLILGLLPLGFLINLKQLSSLTNCF